MGLGGTAKKLQKVANMAEDLYARLNDLREELAMLRETVEQTNTDVEQIRYEQQVNRALLERMAEQQGIDVNETLERVSTDISNQAPPTSEQDQERGRERRQGESREQGQRRQSGQGTASGSSPDRRSRNG